METSILPSPEQLARKQTTRPLSVRVSQKTAIAFEKYAQEYGTTVSSLVSNLLDAYVERQISFTKEQDLHASQKLMANHMMRLVDRVDRYTDEDLCLYLSDDKEHVEFYGTHMFNAIMDPDPAGRREKGYIQIPFNDGAGTTLIIDAWGKKSHIDFDECRAKIWVPAGKFAITAYMTVGYIQKYEELYNAKGWMDIKALAKITNIVNSIYDRRKLAEEIGKVYASIIPQVHEEKDIVK